nr:unnamed protein product [Naegleria fowleri]
MLNPSSPNSSNSPTAFTTMVASMKETFQSGVSRKREWRVDQLKRMIAMFEANRSEWELAQEKDLAQTQPLKTTEVNMPIHSAHYLLDNLNRLMATESVPITNTGNIPAEGFIVKEPLGVVLIIGAWNYPISLMGIPFAGALAAGNLVILKPSEVSPNCSALFAKLVPKYFDEKYVRCVEGDASVSTELLKEPYDHIFYTGSIRVGKIIMRAASEHLTPVTLELGGKSPLILDSDIDCTVAANRITWGKTFNCGQTCVAPDYILLDSAVADKFIPALEKAITQMYGEDASKSPDYSRIVSVNHTKRLKGMIDQVKDKVIYGGNVDENAKYVQPTLVLNPDLDNDLVMQEEIFGPIMPIIIYGEKKSDKYPSKLANLDAALKFINSRSKPLALYIYTKNQALVEKIMHITQSGAVGINECVMQVAEELLPFGGVGYSGMGAYHGDSSFYTFTHKKSVLKKKYWLDLDLRYPPLTETKKKLLITALSDNFLTRYIMPVGGWLLSIVNKCLK